MLSYTCEPQTIKEMCDNFPFLLEATVLTGFFFRFFPGEQIKINSNATLKEDTRNAGKLYAYNMKHHLCLV